MARGKIYLLCLFCLIAGVQVSAQSDDHGSGSALVWRQSRQLLTDNAERLKSRLAADPDNLTLQLDYGRACYWLALEREQQAVIEAERVFQKVLAREPNNVIALAHHGALLGLKIGFGLVPGWQIANVSQQSQLELDRAVALAPDEIEVRYLRGYTSFYSPSIVGRDALAVEDFTRVTELLSGQPNSEQEMARVYLVLGDSFRKMGQTEEAREKWRRVIQLTPDSGHALAAEARLRRQADEIEMPATNVKELIAFLGFLLGVVIFAMLTALVGRDLWRAHGKRRGERVEMLTSLAISLAAFGWNAWNLLLIVTRALNPSTPPSISPGAPLAIQHLDLSGPFGIHYEQSAVLLLALSPIPFGLIAVYRFYKASFMDIALKRGAALMALLALALVYAQFIEARLWSVLLRVSNPELRQVFYVGIWLALFACYPWLRDRIYRFVDRHLFKRRNYEHLLDEFNERLRAATDEASLLEALVESLRLAFAAESAKLLPAGDELWPRLRAAMRERQSEVLLARQIADDDLANELMARRVELLLALRAGEEDRGMILIGPRAYGQSYLSEELSVLRAITGQINRTLEVLRLHEVRRKQAIAAEEWRKLAAQAELKALRAQIDPHFFFNALNSVAALINRDPAAAETLLEDLADLFRYAFKPRRDFIALDEELQLVEVYLKVEQVRLGEKLCFQKTIAPDALPLRIPALSVQPLVENAVKHGIAKTVNGGNVTLSATVKDEHLTIIVADTGAGLEAAAAAQLMSRGVGLSNVNDRLVALYGEQSKLRIDGARGQGAAVSFTIPLGQDQILR